jgi:hypothetical protein
MVTPNTESGALRKELEEWLSNRDDVIEMKERARLEGTHFLLAPHVYDPETLDEPLRTMAMRALGYTEDTIARANEPQASRPYEDFALKFIRPTPNE